MQVRYFLVRHDLFLFVLINFNLCSNLIGSLTSKTISKKHFTLEKKIILINKSCFKSKTRKNSQKKKNQMHFFIIKLIFIKLNAPREKRALTLFIYFLFLLSIITVFVSNSFSLRLPFSGLRLAYFTRNIIHYRC